MATPRSNASHSKRHESFAASAVLPGENPEEFDMLVSVIRDRLQPVGYLEEQQVVTIAEFSWRKRRLGIFRVAANARARFGACFAEGDIEIVSRGSTSKGSKNWRLCLSASRKPSHCSKN